MDGSPPRHQTHVEPSFLEVNGIQSRGDHYPSVPRCGRTTSKQGASASPSTSSRPPTTLTTAATLPPPPSPPPPPPPPTTAPPPSAPPPPSRFFAVPHLSFFATPARALNAPHSPVHQPSRRSRRGSRCGWTPRRQPAPNVPHRRQWRPRGRRLGGRAPRRARPARGSPRRRLYTAHKYSS